MTLYGTKKVENQELHYDIESTRKSERVHAFYTDCVRSFNAARTTVGGTSGNVSGAAGIRGFNAIMGNKVVGRRKSYICTAVTLRVDTAAGMDIESIASSYNIRFREA